MFKKLAKQIALKQSGQYSRRWQHLTILLKTNSHAIPEEIQLVDATADDVEVIHWHVLDPIHSWVVHMRPDDGDNYCPGNHVFLFGNHDGSRPCPSPGELLDLCIDKLNELNQS